MKGAPCVVSVAEHTGWAHLVCVAAPGLVPAVVARRRVTLIDSGLPTQPYEHDSTAMREDEADALIAQVRRSIEARTSDALTRVVAEHGNPNAKSDASVALGLAMQAAGGARANVEINVDSVGDADYAVAKEPWFADAYQRAREWADTTGWRP